MQYTPYAIFLPQISILNISIRNIASVFMVLLFTRASICASVSLIALTLVMTLILRRCGRNTAEYCQPLQLNTKRLDCFMYNYLLCFEKTMASISKYDAFLFI